MKLTIEKQDEWFDKKYRWCHKWDYWSACLACEKNCPFYKQCMEELDKEKEKKGE